MYSFKNTVTRIRLISEIPKFLSWNHLMHLRINMVSVDLNTKIIEFEAPKSKFIDLNGTLVQNPYEH